MVRYLTAHVIGTGGVIKEIPEDFIVEEIPAYPTSGEGEHVFTEIEKRGLTTFEAIRRIARLVSLNERDFGYAGLKDSRGVTRQTFSIPRIAPDILLRLDIPGITILSARRHRNKLKPGHLWGNRFEIRVRDVSQSAENRARQVLAILSERGVPNYFGEQRYGSQGNSNAIGGAILRGDHRGAVDAIIGDPKQVRDEHWQAAIEAYRRGDLEQSAHLFPGHCRTERDLIRRLMQRPEAYEKALHAVHPRLKSLYLSAWQSSLFDRLLERRLDNFDRVMTGDLAWRHDNGACFLVEDQIAEAARAQRFEISASGPMFGSRMSWPRGEPQILEEDLLREEGIDPAGPAVRDAGLGGERRPLRVPLSEWELEAAGDQLLLKFSLPRGAYATSVLREIMKVT